MISKLLSRSMLLPLLALVVWYYWPQIGPHKPDMSPARQDLAAQFVADIAEDLRQNKGAVQSVILLHFEGDPTDFISESLASVLERRGVFNLYWADLPYRLRDLLNMRHPSGFSKKDAAQSASAVGLDAALVGRVKRFETHQSGAADVDIEYMLISADGTKLHAGAVKASLADGSVEPATARISPAQWADSLPRNGALLLAAVLLLPMLGISFLRAMARRNSNTANAGVLAVFTTLNVISAYLIFGANLEGAGLVFLLVAVGSLGFLYNARILSFVISLEDA